MRMIGKARAILAVTAAVAVASPAFGWWDTIVKNWAYPPLVEAYEAESLAGVPKDAVKADDLSASRQSVEMTSGGAKLSFSRDLQPSTYAVYIVGRSPRASDKGDPGVLPPFFFTVSITDPAGSVQRYRLRAAYQYVYTLTYGSEEMQRCYFHALTPGRYTVEIAVGERTMAPSLFVDRLELRDALGNCAKQAGKTARTMMSDEVLKNLRGGTLKPVEPLPRAEVLARCRSYFAAFPPLNAPRQSTAKPGHFKERDQLPADTVFTGWKANALDQPWVITNAELGAAYTLDDFRAGKMLPGLLADDGWGVSVGNLTYVWGEPEPAGGTFSVIAPLFQSRLSNLVETMLRRAKEYQQSGDPIAGLEGSAILLAFAHYYPALDFRAQAAWPVLSERFGFANHVGGGMVISGLIQGHAIKAYVEAYDQLFDFIKANEAAFAEAAGQTTPWVKAPSDLYRFLDLSILQRTADANMRGDAAGDSLKMSLALTMAALSQGPNDISQKWVDILVNNIPMGMIQSGGLEDLAYGELGRDGLVSKGAGGYSKGSIMSLMDVVMMLRDYKRLGGKVAVDLADFKAYPWMRDALFAPINLRVAGGWVPLLGDYGDPLRFREVYFDTGPTQKNSNKPYYLDCWRLTRDSRFAHLAWRYGKTTETADEWAAIEAAAKSVRNPLDALPPRVLDDLGLAILESGQQQDGFTNKAALTLRYGAGHTHGHNDGLDLAVWGKGMRAITDLAAREGWPSPRLQKVHNTVEVDRKSMNNEDDTIPGYGWLNAFSPFEGVQYADASQRARSHPQLTEYRRGVALIDVGGTDAYVFNVQRVAGGSVHTWCAHANQNDQFEVNAKLEPARSPAALEYMKGFKTPETLVGAAYAVSNLFPRPAEGTAPADLVATWRLHPRAEQAFRSEKLADDRKIYARWRLFDHEGEALYAANGTSDKYRYDMTFLFVQNDKVDPAGSVFPSLAEVYQGQPVVQSAREVKFEDGGKGAARTVGLAVQLPEGVSDLCLSGPADGTIRKAEGGVSFDGLFGFIRKDKAGLERAVLVGGAALEAPGLSIRLPKGRIAGEVVATDPAANSCTVKGDFRDVDLVGRMVPFVSPGGRSYAFTVTGQKPVEGGVTLTLKEKMKIFQSSIEYVDEAKREITVRTEPYNLKGDKNAYDDTEIGNEGGSKRWPSKIVCESRWLIVKTPIAEADLDTVDGKRTLSLIGDKTDGGKAGEPMLTLEVTRLEPETGTIYFKQPVESPFDIEGWCYVNRQLVNKAGKRWMATYPGFEYKIVTQGPVKAADFTDANGDGRAVLSLYRLAPGYTLSIPAAVSVRRAAGGRFEIDSFTPAEVNVAGARVER
ncbi:MAG: hypothetical protein R6X19_00820 [Kiritimatiellia bacterium]